MNVAVAKAAELLVLSRRCQVRLPGLPADLQPQDLDHGYAIQLAVARQSSACAMGFKIGMTNENAQRAAGTAAPIVGRLALPDILRAPARVAVDAGHLRVVEAEVVFEMGDDLPASAAPFSEAQIAERICGVFAGIEICDSRFSKVDAMSLAHIVADNSNADRIVIGDALECGTGAELANLEVTLTFQGRAPVRGSTSRVLGHPLRSVTWLANWLAARGEGLRRGQWVASGSCTGITQAARSDVVVATFGGRDRVSVELAPEARNEVTS